MRKIGHVHCETGLHIHDAAPEKPVAGNKILSGVVRNIALSHAGGVGIGVEGQIGQVAAHVRIHHVEMPVQKHGSRGFVAGPHKSQYGRR